MSAVRSLSSGSGASAGLVVGVPLSTSLGHATGWRVAFGLLAVTALRAPSCSSSGCCRAWSHAPTDRAPAGRAPRAGRGCRCRIRWRFSGQFTVYTFISVLLLASGVSPVFVGPILLVCGACGLLGLWYVGRHLDRNPTTNRGAPPCDTHRLTRGPRARRAHARRSRCGSCCLVCRVRRCAVDLSSVRGTDACGVAGNGRCVDECQRQHRDRRRGGDRRRPASDNGLWSLPVGERVCLAALGLAVVAAVPQSIPLACRSGEGLAGRVRASTAGSDPGRRWPARNAISRSHRSGTARTGCRWRSATCRPRRVRCPRLCPSTCLDASGDATNFLALIDAPVGADAVVEQPLLKSLRPPP